MKRSRLLRGTAIAVSLAAITTGLAACASSSETATDAASEAAPSEAAPASSAAPAEEVEATAEPITGWKLGFSFGLDDTPIYSLVLPPAQKRAAELGLSLVEGSAKSKCETQIANIESMISSGVKAVTFLGLCGDGAAYDKVVAQGKEADVTMVSYAFEAAGADGSITFNDEQAGTDMAEDAIAWATEKFGGDFTDFSWGMLECSFVPPSIASRFSIPKELVTAATGKKPLTADCANDPASAQKVVETWLKKDKGLDMVLAYVDSGGLGAYQAFKQSGAAADSVYVAGIDGQKEVLDLLAAGGDGIYQASYALPLTGPIMVNVPYDIINNSGPSTVLLGYTGLYASDPAGVQTWIDTQITPWQ